MRIFILILSMVVLGQFGMASLAKAQSSSAGSIAVVVNEDAVTMSDVEDRVTLIVRSSGMPDNEEMRSKIRPQVIDVLIEEQLKLQEAERLGVEVSQEQIDQGFAQLAKQNIASPEQFRDL